MQLSAIFTNLNIQQPQQTRSRNVSSPRYIGNTNLAPLKRDTVSFGATCKEMGLNAISQGINHNTALKIHEDALVAQNYLHKQLDSILGDMVRPKSGKGALSRPIDIIRYRTKSAKSIREKAGARKLYNTKEIKENLTDIIGARIVMADANIKSVNEVMDRLTNAVNKDHLKVLEIENYRPDPLLDDEGNVKKVYDYASPRALGNLRDACLNKGIDIHKRDEDIPSGYMAIHMLGPLPNGFTGEIQLMGKDVEALKEVEDTCYKVKNGKHLEKQYAPVEKMLKPLANKEDTILRKGYMDYTRQAYLAQRAKEPRRSKQKDYTFMHIPESLDYIPPQLDFNNIYAEMKKCGFSVD